MKVVSVNLKNKAPWIFCSSFLGRDGAWVIDVGNNCIGTHDQPGGLKTARSEVLFLPTPIPPFLNLGDMDTIFTLRGLVRGDTEISNEMAWG